MFSESYICKTKILLFLNGHKGKLLKHCGMPPYGSHRELHSIQAAHSATGSAHVAKTVPNDGSKSGLSKSDPPI